MAKDRTGPAQKLEHGAPRGSRPKGLPEAQRSCADRLVRELFQLISETDSAQCDVVRHKDSRAHEALVLGSLLFDFLAGWARDHLVGRVVNGIPGVFYAPGTKREQSLGEDRPWDDPALEAQGAAYDFSDASLNQKIVTEFVRSSSQLFAHDLAFRLGEAFEALTFGQVTDLVRPAKRHLKGAGYQLWLLRLEAAKHAAFRHGTGLRKEDALMRVADAYQIGNPPDVEGWKTVERWEARLPQMLDPFMVHDYITMAYQHGQWHAHLSKQSKLDPQDQEFLDDLDGKYGQEALDTAGSRFRRIQPKRRT